jgi:methyltransferase
VTPAILLLAFVTFQRLGELVLARRNTAALLGRGGREVGAEHYPLIVALHAAWLGGLWFLAADRPVSLPWLAVFVALQAGRVWVLASLGERWTTRIIVLPEAPLKAGGPYRFLSHPNYAVVAGEIAVLPLVFGLTGYALLFSVLNALVLFARIGAESAALAATASRSQPGRAGERRRGEPRGEGRELGPGELHRGDRGGKRQRGGKARPGGEGQHGRDDDRAGESPERPLDPRRDPHPAHQGVAREAAGVGRERHQPDRQRGPERVGDLSHP